VPEINDFRNGARSLGAIREFSPYTLALQGKDDAVRVNAGLVTGNFFEVMGLSAVAGRLTGPGVNPHENEMAAALTLHAVVRPHAYADRRGPVGNDRGRHLASIR
jgi:hypothetical protein